VHGTGAIAVRDRTSWKGLGTGVDGIVEAIAISYGYVYVGGAFDTAGGTPANGIARWKR